MQKDDVKRLADLARIELTDSELESFTREIGGILAYVEEIKSITGDAPPEKVVGPVFNVMRKDEAPHEPGHYTEDLLRAAPEHEGEYVKVKKILGDI